jgi:hypothetical protein
VKILLGIALCASFVWGQDNPAVAAKVVDAAPAAAKNKSETLRFSVNWPSGLSLGEGELSSVLADKRWTFAFKADAAVPGFAVREAAQSKASDALCSVEFTKQSTRGKRVSEEKTTFDSSAMTATRETIKGGKSEIKTSGCARDALTFLQFLRRELAAGRLPAVQPVYYGGGYITRAKYIGTQRIRSGAEMVEADKLELTIKAAASEIPVEIFFARDEARTPMVANIPVALGKFSVEFTR